MQLALLQVEKHFIDVHPDERNGTRITSASDSESSDTSDTEDKADAKRGAKKKSNKNKKSDIQTTSDTIKGEGETTQSIENNGGRIPAKRKKGDTIWHNELQDFPEPTAPELDIIINRSKEEEDVANFSDVDDAEIECYILSDQDVQTKKKLWYHFNKDYLKEQQEKAKLKEEQELKPKVRKPRKKRGPAGSATEAAEQILQKNLPKKSSLINWDAYNSLFQKLEGGGFDEVGNDNQNGATENVDEIDEKGEIYHVEEAQIEDEHLNFSSDEEAEDPLGFL